MYESEANRKEAVALQLLYSSLKQAWEEDSFTLDSVNTKTFKNQPECGRSGEIKVVVVYDCGALESHFIPKVNVFLTVHIKRKQQLKMLQSSLDFNRLQMLHMLVF